VSFSGADNNGNGRLRGLVFNNYGLKLLALVFAAALWYLVVGEKVTEVGVQVPIGLKGLPEDMIVVDNPPLMVEIKVSGPTTFIKNLSSSEVRGAIDLSGAKEGLNTFRMHSGDISVPTGLRVAGIKPFTLNIRLERLMRLMVPVRAVVEGSPEEGYEVKEIVIEPKDVEVSGRKKSVKKVKAVETEAVDVTGVNSDMTLNVPLDTSGMEFTDVRPESVAVKIVVVKRKGRI